MFALDEKDLKVIEILTRIGVKKQIASVLVFLNKVKSATSKEIEIGAELRQPEVSTAVKELKELGWVNESTVKKKGKGRPMYAYSLSVDFKEVVKQIIEKKRQELEEEKRKIEEIVKIVEEM